MNLDIYQVSASGHCPFCGKEIDQKDTDFIVYLGDTAGVEVDECPHCKRDLSYFDDIRNVEVCEECGRDVNYDCECDEGDED